MRKGQAAMEFLSTYGFSFMIILAALGAMFYLGIFNITNFVPDSCDLGSNLFCPIVVLEKDATHFAVNMQLVNNGPSQVVITNMSIKDAGSQEYCFIKDITDVAGVPLTKLGRTIPSRQDIETVFEFKNATSGCNFADSFFETTNKRKFDVRLYYVSVGASQETSQSGSITAKPTLWS